MNHQPSFDLSVALLHDQMLDKVGKTVTTSITMIDVHDIARSSRTFGLRSFYVAHPSPTLQRLVNTLKTHWEEGFGATYNPNRRDALSRCFVVDSLDQAIAHCTEQSGHSPHIIATSARSGGTRTSFSQMRELLTSEKGSFLLLLGTGWGMTEDLLARAQYFLDPVHGPTDYNHLSVRSACAIMLDRLVGVR